MTPEGWAIIGQVFWEGASVYLDVAAAVFGIFVTLALFHWIRRVM